MHNEIKNILVASTNSGKVSEFSAMLDSDIISWRGLTEFKGLDEVVEDGETFVENARKKAVEYAELVVDALDGAPGVKSARFSGEKPPEGERQLLDEKNMQKVLELMKNVPTKKRTCRFKCFLCLASPGKVLAETEGTLEGFIAETQAGINGFGYDPIFFVPELGKTVAQLKQEQKNLISHRSKALAKMKSELDRLKKV
jgi:XTP/dITP diphosphohydrolase